MGFDCELFETTVDEELICSICSGVFDDPVQIQSCEHAFCRECIKEWCTRRSTCPVDRKEITISQLHAVPRILRNMLSRLRIKCDNFNHGCLNYFPLDQLDSHLEICKYDPKRPVPCPYNCGLNVAKSELSGHNCARELRKMVCQLTLEQGALKATYITQEKTLTELQQELIQIKDSIKVLKELNPNINELIERHNREELLKWSRRLTRAVVIHWSNIIPEPDERTKTLIKSALIEYNCPTRYLQSLLANCNEQNWPSGMASPEARELNHIHFDDYICRRLLGQTALLLLSIDNGHMNDDMMVEPGIIVCLRNGFY